MLKWSSYFLEASAVLIAISLVAYIAGVALNRPSQVPEPVPVGGGVAGQVEATGSSTAPDGGRSHGMLWYGSKISLVAFLLLTASLACRAIATGHGPFANQHEFAVSFAWGVLAAWLYFEHRFGVRTMALFVMPVCGAIMLYALLIDREAQPLVPALQNNLLLSLHVATAVLSYGAAAVAFGAAVLYLAHPRLQRIRSLPSQAMLDEIGYRAAVIAYPLMTVMIILGAIWAEIAWSRYWSWDPKETAALVTWLIYGAYLHARVVRDWRGSRAAWLLILGFAAVLFTYFGNYFFTGLHSYA